MSTVLNTKCLWLIFFVLCDAKIKIYIAPASTKFRTSINYTGIDEETVSHKDIRLFNLTDDNLKHGFRVELGKKPDEVFLYDPTPYGKVFKKFKWKESKRTINIKSAVVMDIVNENVIIKLVEDINNTTDVYMKQVNVFENIENTISSIWPVYGVPEHKALINVTLDFGTKKIQFFNKWKSKNYKAFSMQFGSKQLSQMKIRPGEKMITELSAKKTIIFIKIVYKTYLTGRLFGNYARLYGKYHFWAPAVGDIMKAAKLPNSNITTEIFEIKCFTDPKIRAYNKITGETITFERLSKQFHTKKKMKTP